MLLRTMRMVMFGLAVVAAAVPAMGQPIIEGIRTCKNAYSREDESKLGQKVAEGIYKQQPVLQENDPIAVYVRQLGQRLVASAPDQDWAYNFHVVDSDQINAFALPGGAVFVNLATITAAENEAQLAGVMAHEISHVVLRHSTCNLTRQQKRGIFYGLGQVAAGAILGGGVGDLASSGIGYAANLNFLHMSRGSEQEADLLGVQIMYDAGYDPRGMPQFFETIQAKYGSGGAQFLSDHPNPGNRTQYVMAAIQRLPPRSSNTVTSNAFRKAHEEAGRRAPLTPEQTQKGDWKNSSAYAKGPS